MVADGAMYGDEPAMDPYQFGSVAGIARSRPEALGRRNMSIGFEEVVAGDEVFVDNSDFLAYANFTRHQNEDIPEFSVFPVDGTPVYPQRARATGSPELYLVAPYEAAFGQKMIVIQNTHDAQCWPCAPQNLRRLLVGRRGTDSDLRHHNGA